MLGSGAHFHVNVVVGIYKFDPITAVSCRAKTMSLLRASILFRPHLSSPASPLGRARRSERGKQSVFAGLRRDKSGFWRGEEEHDDEGLIYGLDAERP